MKKYYIPIFCMLLLCLAAMLSGCSDSEPVKLVKSELSQIQKLDEKTIRNFISYEDIIHSGSASDIGSEATEAVQLFFKNFSYRVLSSSATEDSATVNVEIKNIDAQSLARDLCLELIAMSSSPSTGAESMSSKSSYFSLLRDILSSHEYALTKTTAHFHLTNKDGQWTIRSDETLEDQIVSGFISFLKDPDLVTPEEITVKVFENLQKQTPSDWVSYLGMHDIFSTYSTLYEKVDLALATQISKCFSYRIQKVTEQTDAAEAVVEVTSLDMESVLDVYLKKLLDYASTTEAVRATDTELADKTAALLSECLNSNTKTCCKTIHIEFTNNGTTWEMQMNDDFTNALLGNMTEAVEKFQKEALPATT